MTIQRLKTADAVVLSNPGKRSAQIVWHGNAADAQATITRVTMDPGAVSALHSHPRSEQIWFIEEGEALLLFDDDRAEPLAPGDVVRTPPGDVHGVKNVGSTRFVYLTITCPPENMSSFYQQVEN